MSCSIIQTFFIDKNAVNDAASVNLTSIDLYFKYKPLATNNASGIVNPGVSIFICNVDVGVPTPSIKKPDSIVRLPYDIIVPSSDASVATKFNFTTPIPVDTGNYYGIVIMFEDNGYELWHSRHGDRLVGTNIPSPGPAGKYKGNFFEYTDPTNPVPLLGYDLKFGVTIARYTSNTINVQVTNDNFEFLDINTSKNFIGGDIVFKDVGGGNTTFYRPGTINISNTNSFIVGNGTNFISDLTANTKIIIHDVNDINYNSNVCIRTVSYVANNTYLNLDFPPTFNNSAARYKISPLGTVYSFDGINQNIILKSSTSSNVDFFTNSCVNYVTTSGTSGWVQNDIINIGGDISANLVVEQVSGGSISKINIINPGHNINVSSITIPGGRSGTITPVLGSRIVSEITKSIANVKNVNNYRVDQFDSEILAAIPADCKITGSYVFSNTEYYVSNTNKKNLNIVGLNSINNYQAVVASRTNELLNPTNLSNPDSKSSIIDIKLETNKNPVTTNIFSSPHVYEEKIDLFTLRNVINNDITNEDLPQGGNARCKHISTKISFANNILAEDLVVYITAWKPLGTNINIYSKFYNPSDSDSFDDKNWTPLEQTSPQTNIFSNKSNNNDLIEYIFSVSKVPKVKYTTVGVVTSGTGISNTTFIGANTKFDDQLLPGTVTVSKQTTEIVGLGTNFLTGKQLVPGGYIDIVSTGGIVNTRKIVNIVSDTSMFVETHFDFSEGGIQVANPNRLIPGDFIRIYDQNFNNNFICKVATVTSNTNIDIDQPLIDSNLNNGVSGIKIDKLFFDRTGWKNEQNSNIVRYYNSSDSMFDGFNSFAIKIVLTAENSNIAPEISDIRAIGVSS